MCPYFSDLQRFADVSRFRNFHSQTRNLLFSGSLIKRKGVDLLPRAFTEVAHEFSNLTLSFMGTGELEDELRRQLAPLVNGCAFLVFSPGKICLNIMRMPIYCVRRQDTMVGV